MAIAQGGGDDRPIGIPGGCIAGTKQVTIRIRPRANAMLSPVNIRSGHRVRVHLTGVTQAASVTVRLAAGPLTVERGDNRRRPLLRSAQLPPLLAARPADAAGASGPVTGGGEG